jgi:hypothetical protein
MSAPFTGVTVMDAGNAGFGGDVTFDDIQADSQPLETCDG